MITYNKESLNRIAQSLEKMAGVSPDSPSPSGSCVMTCRITGNISSDDTLYLDKTYREISDFVANDGMVQAVVEAWSEDSGDRTTLILLLSSFRPGSIEGHYYVLFAGYSDSIDFYASDIDGVLSTAPNGSGDDVEPT